MADIPTCKFISDCNNRNYVIKNCQHFLASKYDVQMSKRLQLLKLPPLDSAGRLPSPRPPVPPTSNSLLHYCPPANIAVGSNATVNPLMSTGNYSATSNRPNMKLVHWPLIGWLLHLVQRGGDCARPQPSSLYQM